MPTIRKLQPDEVRKSGKGETARAQVAREYDNYLAEFAPDEYGEAVVNEDESKLTVRNRLKAAAARRGLELEFLRTPGQAIRFHVVTPSENGVEDAGDEAGAEGGTENGAPEQAPARKARGRKAAASE